MPVTPTKVRQPSAQRSQPSPDELTSKPQLPRVEKSKSRKKGTPMKMTVFASTAAILTLAAATAFAADGNFERTLSAGSSPNVSVSTGSGQIHLHPGSGDQIHIVGHLHSSHGWMSGGSDTDSRIQQIIANPPIVQSGNDVTIGERHNN